MTAPTINGQLICASKLAYAIQTSGTVPASPPYYVGTGLLKPAEGFATGSSRIDAALVGTAEIGVIVAFRGTLPPSTPDHQQTLKDWMQDLELGLVVDDKMPGRVHRGFLNALDSLWPDVSDAVVRQLADSDKKRLFITGHSKGGPVAHLAAARFVTTNLVHGSDIMVRTFEGAHPGDQAFADTYGRLVQDVIRFEHADDLVPHLPPSIMMRHLFKSEEFFKPLMAIDNNVDYAPVGELRFIDWDGNVRSASALLSTERMFHLASQIAIPLHFENIVTDHSIDCGTVPMQVVCPVGVCC